ncbi:unnamed protein product, partial [Callosobruchus maculatus]
CFRSVGLAPAAAPVCPDAWTGIARDSRLSLRLRRSHATTGPDFRTCVKIFQREYKVAARSHEERLEDERQGTSSCLEPGD